MRELGIALDTVRVTDSTGRQIGAYEFSDPKSIAAGKLGGRKTWPKELKETLIKRDGCVCGYCGTAYESRYLSIDHRIPYEIGGDDGDLDSVFFMLLCGSCQRSKSWSCEHCPNVTAQVVATCETCIWAHPNNYEHVATVKERRVTLVWTGNIAPWEQLRTVAVTMGLSIEDAAKSFLP